MRFYSAPLFLYLLACGCLLVVSGCGNRTAKSTPHTPHAVPETWQSSSANGQLIPYWLSSLNDALLEQLVREAWSANPDVIMSAARYRQAVARAQQSGALRLPTVQAQAGAGRSRSNVELGNNQVTSIYRNDFNMGLSVGWELDVWDRLGALARADIADTRAAAYDITAAYRSLAAQVARAWYRLGYEQLRHQLISDFLDVAILTEKLLTERYQDGRTPAVDVRAARADVARARVDLAERQRAVKEAARTLEILLGRYPGGSIQGPPALATPPPPPPAGIPAIILFKRPDVRAAHQRLLASDERVASAQGDLLPRLSLTASGGTRSTELRNLLDPDYIVWNLVGNLTQPLFDGGRLSAVVAERKARVDEAAAAYAKVATAALREVETALTNSEIIIDEVTQGKKAADESDAVVTHLRDRYRDGLIDGLTLLRERRTALNQRITYLSLRLDDLFIRIDLLLALGGAALVNEEAEAMEHATTAPVAGDKP